MPVFKQHLMLDIARGVRAFLNLEAGITRSGATPGPQQAREQKERLGNQNQELEQARRELAVLRARLSRNGTKTGVGGANPDNIVWIFGSGRSGSTWLSSMMGDVEGHTLWGEPWVGTLFGNYYYRSVDERKHQAPHFIMGPHRETWLGSIRNFVLDGANAIFPALSKDGFLIIKEPNGSRGAPLMMEALPESRMVLLTRDPRDVVASYMDARREGGWNYERNKRRYLEGRKVPADENPVAFAQERAERYVRAMGKAKEAYDAHQGHKVLVKYEELRADTLGEMKRIYSTLDIPVSEEELARIVEKHSWENIPEDKKGEGKFYRKATPGGWREDLTSEQAEVVEEITAPLLKELYPEKIG